MAATPQALPFPEAKTPLQRGINNSAEHAELIGFVLFLISLSIWIWKMPSTGKTYVDPTLAAAAAKTGPDQAQSKIDLDVWTRFEEDYSHFKWGVDLNLYLYASLKTLAIILSAVTPALIVAPFLQDKKVLAALPAVVVAVATGLIGEFDFKVEAARFDTAKVQLETEKSMFITRAGPFYTIG